MSRKFFAGLVLVLMFCGGACASDFSLSSYFQVDWKEVGGYVAGWFGSGEKNAPASTENKNINQVNQEVLPEHLASNWTD